MKYLPRIASVYMGVVFACIAGGTAGAAKSEEVEARAVLNSECVLADEPYYVPDATGVPRDKSLSMLGIVVGKVAEVMIQHALRMVVAKWRTRGIETWSARLPPTDLYLAKLDPAPELELNDQLGCLTIITGDFEPESTDCSAQYEPRTITPEILRLPESEWRTSRTLDSLQNQLRRANVCTRGEPRSVMEARFEFSADGTGYRLADAGHRFNALLGTADAKAERFVFYTFEINQPGTSNVANRLSTAWVELGSVRAGTIVPEGSGSARSEAPWLQLPQLSGEARRIYEDRTGVHQDTHAQIEALERAIVRETRTVVSLTERLSSAPRDVADGLREPLRTHRVTVATLQAELDAHLAEYAELPHDPLKLMPVAMSIGVTEARSEKRGQAMLAKLVESGSGSPAPAAAVAVARSIAPGANDALRPAGSAAALAAELRAARDAYYDAQLAARLSKSPSGASLDVTQAKARYDAARRAVGVEVAP